MATTTTTTTGAAAHAALWGKRQIPEKSQPQNGVWSLCNRNEMAQKESC